MDVVESVPPPAYSDGKEEFVTSASKKGLKISRSFVGPYFRQVLQSIKDVYLQYPGEMSPPKAPGSYRFSPIAVMDKLPANYELFSDPHNGNLSIVGHPRFLEFSNLVGIILHLLLKCFLTYCG